MGLLEVVREAELNFREQKGIEKGREEGRKEAREEVIKNTTKIVRNMLKANLKVEAIADLADVTIEFVLKIKTEMENNKN